MAKIILIGSEVIRILVKILEIQNGTGSHLGFWNSSFWFNVPVGHADGMISVNLDSSVIFVFFCGNFRDENCNNVSFWYPKGASFNSLVLAPKHACWHYSPKSVIHLGLLFWNVLGRLGGRYIKNVVTTRQTVKLKWSHMSFQSTHFSPLYVVHR